MKRTYISPEYTVFNTVGTYNAAEEKSFFSSKMIEIEDTINIKNGDIIYYQTSNGEQLSITKEMQLDPISLKVDDLKKINQNIDFDNKQSKYDKENNTKWTLTINTNEILKNYIFAKLKEVRTFEGILNSDTYSNNINQFINDYISNNLMNRYEIQDLILYIKYNAINQLNSNLVYNNVWNTSLTSNDVNATKTVDRTNLNNVKIHFTQKYNSKDYNFDYYYDIIFKKI